MGGHKIGSEVGDSIDLGSFVIKQVMAGHTIESRGGL